MTYRDKAFRLLTRGPEANARGAELAGSHPETVEHEWVVGSRRASY